MLHTVSFICTVCFVFASISEAQVAPSGFDFGFVESRGSVGYTATRDGVYRFGDTIGGGVDGAGADAASISLLNANGTRQGTEIGFAVSQFRSTAPAAVELSSHASVYAESIGKGTDTTTGLSNVRFDFQYDQPFIVRGSGFIRTTRTDAGAMADGLYSGRILVSEGFGASRTILNASISGSEADEIEFSFEQIVEPIGAFDTFRASLDLDSFGSSELFGEGAGFGVEAELSLEFLMVPAPGSVAIMGLSGLVACRRRR